MAIIRFPAGLLAAMTISAGLPGCAAAGHTSPATRPDLYIHELLGIAVRPGATLDQLSSHFDFVGKQDVEDAGFGLSTTWSIASLRPGLGVQKMIISPKPGSPDRIGSVRFVLMAGEESGCVDARAFADRVGLVASAPMHPDAITEHDVARVSYTGRISDAQVSAVTRPDGMGCLEELFVWHRHAGRPTP